MTAQQYRKWQALLAKAREFHEECRYRTDERMGILYGAEPMSRKRIVVIHQVREEMEMVVWK